MAQRFPQVPDSTGSVNLEPGAHQVGNVSGSATRQDIAPTPEVSQLSHLANALHSIQPTLIGLSQDAIATKTQELASEGEIAGQKAAMDQSVKNVNAAVSAGLLPEGASPTFNMAAKANFLKLRGEQAQVRFREDYYNNTELRNSDDPKAFNDFASKWQQDYTKAHLEGADGKPLYSSLELAKSNFFDRTNQGIQGVHGEHIAHRVSEREKLGEETASNLAATRVDQVLGVGLAMKPSEQRDYRGAANALADVYYNAETGQAAYGGMNKSKAARAMADTILAKAISEKDPHLLEIAEHVLTPGGSLSGTQYFKEKSEDARQKIAGIKYTDAIHKETLGKMEIEGTFEERMAHYGDVFQRTAHETAKKNYIVASEAKILSYGDFNKMSGKQLQQQAEDLNDLRKVDPDAALRLEQRIDQAKEHKQTAADKALFPISEMDLYNSMLKAPGTAATNSMIDQSLRTHMIGGDEWRRLRAKSDQDGQDKIKFAKWLDDPIYKHLEDGVRTGVAKDLSKISGQESLAGAYAATDFRMAAIGFLKANPKATAVDLATFMRPHVSTISENYNAVMKEEVDRAKADEETQKLITDLKLTAAEAKPVLANEGKVPGQPDRATTNQVLRATAGEKAQKAKDAEAAKPPKDFNTVLSPKNEETFKAWKQKYAPKDSGDDYDLRGAFKAGLKPDPKNGHWDDKFKKPNHPTFSTFSQYAAFGKPGTWDGDTFIPAK